MIDLELLQWIALVIVAIMAATALLLPPDGPGDD